MIIKDISNKKWERASLQYLQFFSILCSVASALLLLFWLFSPSLPSFQQKGIKEALFFSKQDTHFLWDQKNKTPTLVTPKIEKEIFFGGANFRPDANTTSIALSSEKQSIVAKLHEPIYLSLLKGKVLFSQDPTPFSITPKHATKNSLQVTLTTTYTGEDGKVIYKDSTTKTLERGGGGATALSPLALDACKSLSKTQYLGQDHLLELFGGKGEASTKHCSRLLFKNNHIARCFPIKQGTNFHYLHGNWQLAPNPSKDAPLFTITSLSKKEIKGTFWNENGFFTKEYTIPFTRRSTTNVHAFSFDKVYRRNSDSVVCTIKDRTFLLKQNDWLVKKNASWQNLKSLKELEQILGLQSPAEILIFKDIKKEKDREVFIGYIFDKTRSNYKKLEIPLKKKEIVRYTK